MTVTQLSLFRVHLDSQGYTAAGEYFGRTDEHLWCYELPEEYATWHTHDYVRARTRSEAKQAIKDKFPKDYPISFYR